MDREFKSKVGWWYHLVLLVMVITTTLVFIKGGNPIAMVFLLLFTLLSIHMLVSTWYRVTADGWLIVHCSIFPEKKIAIADITGVESTTNLISSPALSLDRLEIWVGLDTRKRLWNIISPNNKQEFVKVLKKINPEIEIKGLDSMSLF